MTTHDAPPIEFKNLPAGQLHAAGLTWLERAARMAVDDATMFETVDAPPASASHEAKEVSFAADKLLQQRNIAEARLCSDIGRGLIAAATAVLPLNDDLIRRYSGHSPDPV